MYSRVGDVLYIGRKRGRLSHVDMHTSSVDSGWTRLRKQEEEDIFIGGLILISAVGKIEYFLKIYVTTEVLGQTS